MRTIIITIAFIIVEYAGRPRLYEQTDKARSVQIIINPLIKNKRSKLAIKNHVNQSACHDVIGHSMPFLHN